MNLIIALNAEGDFAMIDIKPPEEEKSTNLFYQQLEEDSQISEKLNPDAYYLKEISKTLKEILREMRKRKC